MFVRDVEVAEPSSSGSKMRFKANFLVAYQLQFILEHFPKEISALPIV